jgi:hypothetical protein
MRRTRFSSVVGWTAVALLAIAGFAAFNGFDPTSDEVQLEAAQASIGHTSGAYAGLGFVLLGEGGTESGSAEATTGGEQADSAEIDVATGEDESNAAPGTIASPASGWLSQVEVRALVSLYFTEEDVNQAVRVAWCESRFDPEAVDLETGATGLFKHLPRYWPERTANAGFAGADPTDPEASVAAAAWEVYEGGGWDVFGCRG